MIGPMHRRAALLDGRFAIVAGVPSSDPARAEAAGAAIGLPEGRAYPSITAMLAEEARRPDGIEALAVMTPNDSHHAFAAAALDAGLHVICDKPLTVSGEQAEDLLRRVRGSGRVLCVTHPYAGYPMIRQARALVAAGAIGAVRAVQVEYLGSGLAARVEDTPEGARRWRLDPAKAGPSLVLGDIGTHAHHLACFVAGAPIVAVRAELGTLVPGRRTHDYAEVALRFQTGARGRLSLCQAAAGQDNHIALRVLGETGSLDWRHSAHEQLVLSPLSGPKQVFAKGMAELAREAEDAARLGRTGHPEGLLEGFANLYREFAEAITTGIAPSTMPDALDGARGMWFIDAALQSEASGHAWTECRLQPV
jgi:predicted dehydrogenase